MIKRKRIFNTDMISRVAADYEETAYAYLDEEVCRW